VCGCSRAFDAQADWPVRFQRTLRNALEIMIRIVIHLFAACIVTTASAQQPLAYESAFETYRPYREEPVADWRAVNDEVGRVGGHAGIVGGASGHGTHGAAKPADGPARTGQPPLRDAPQSPAGGHAGRH
jgi:hypothetical protein